MLPANVRNISWDTFGGTHRRAFADTMGFTKMKTTQGLRGDVKCNFGSFNAIG